MTIIPKTNKNHFCSHYKTKLPYHIISLSHTTIMRDLKNDIFIHSNIYHYYTFHNHINITRFANNKITLKKTFLWSSHSNLRLLWQLKQTFLGFRKILHVYLWSLVCCNIWLVCTRGIYHVEQISGKTHMNEDLNFFYLQIYWKIFQVHDFWLFVIYCYYFMFIICFLLCLDTNIFNIFFV